MLSAVARLATLVGDICDMSVALRDSALGCESLFWSRDLNEWCESSISRSGEELTRWCCGSLSGLEIGSPVFPWMCCVVVSSWRYGLSLVDIGPVCLSNLLWLCSVEKGSEVGSLSLKEERKQGGGRKEGGKEGRRAREGRKEGGVSLCVTD